MNKTAVKRLLQTLLAQLPTQGPARHLMVRIGMLALSALLTYLGVDTAGLFEDLEDIEEEA